MGFPLNNLIVVSCVDTDGNLKEGINLRLVHPREPLCNKTTVKPVLKTTYSPIHKDHYGTIQYMYLTTVNHLCIKTTCLLFLGGLYKQVPLYINYYIVLLGWSLKTGSTVHQLLQCVPGMAIIYRFHCT